MILSTRFRFFAFKMDAAIFARCRCSPTHHKEVFDICGDEPVIRSKHQFLDSLMELLSWIQDVAVCR